MTVTRRAVRKEEQSQITSLGRILVTIDDLHALFERMQSRAFFGEAAAVISPPAMEFRGGTFDDPNDLRLLTDNELSQISIKTPIVEVILGPDLAKAIGNAHASELVSSSWARSRQTKQRPEFGKRGGLASVPSLRFYMSLSAATVIATAVAVAIAAVTLDTIPILSPVSFAAFLTLIVVTMTSFRITRSPKDYALIKPLTLEQSRTEDRSEKRHLQNAVIALVAVIVALVGVIITILVAM